MAMGVGSILLTIGIATSSDWQRFPPPLALFVFLPIPAGLLAGARLTTELTRPVRLSWRRILGVSAVVLVLAVGSLTTLAVLGAEVGVPFVGTSDLVFRLAEVVLGVPLLTVAWMVVPGVVILPFLVPPVALFALVVRSTGGPTAASPAGRSGKA